MDQRRDGANEEESARGRTPTGLVGGAAANDRTIHLQEGDDIVSAASILPSDGGQSARNRSPTDYVSEGSEKTAHPDPVSPNAKSIRFQEGLHTVYAAGVLPADGERSVRTRIPSDFVHAELSTKATKTDEQEDGNTELEKRGKMSNKGDDTPWQKLLREEGKPQRELEGGRQIEDEDVENDFDQKGESTNRRFKDEGDDVDKDYDELGQQGSRKVHQKAASQDDLAKRAAQCSALPGLERPPSLWPDEPVFASTVQVPNFATRFFAEGSRAESTSAADYSKEVFCSAPTVTQTAVTAGAASSPTGLNEPKDWHDHSNEVLHRRNGHCPSASHPPALRRQKLGMITLAKRCIAETITARPRKKQILSMSA
mgnify:CR=1 FL=1